MFAASFDEFFRCIETGAEREREGGRVWCGCGGSVREGEMAKSRAILSIVCLAFVGINVKKASVSDMKEANVIQPLLVTTSAINLATECVRMLMKIDDIVATR